MSTFESKISDLGGFIRVGTLSRCWTRTRGSIGIVSLLILIRMCSLRRGDRSVRIRRLAVRSVRSTRICWHSLLTLFRLLSRRRLLIRRRESSFLLNSWSERILLLVLILCPHLVCLTVLILVSLLRLIGIVRLILMRLRCVRIVRSVLLRNVIVTIRLPVSSIRRTWRSCSSLSSSRLAVGSLLVDLVTSFFRLHRFGLSFVLVRLALLLFFLCGLLDYHHRNRSSRTTPLTGGRRRSSWTG